MYERFTDNAREVMQRASMEAKRLRHSNLGEEHLLLGLLTGGRAAAGPVVLRTFGVQPGVVRREVEQAIPPSADFDAVDRLPLTSEAKRVIEGAIEAADKEPSRHVETIHLLSALLRAPDSGAFRLLTHIGAPLDAICEGIHAVSTQVVLPDEGALARSSSTSDTPPLTDRARWVLQLADQAARSFEDSFVQPDRLLLAIIDVGPSVATKALHGLGLDERRLRAELALAIDPSAPPRIDPGREYSSETNEILGLAVEEARALHHDYVGTEHLLLALLRLGNARPTDVLGRHGASYDSVRNEIILIFTGQSAGRER